MDATESSSPSVDLQKEYSLVILKPDAVEQDVCLHVLHHILHHLKDLHGKIRATRVLKLSPQLLRDHYAHIANEPFFPRIEKFMLESEVWAAVFEGQTGTIQRIRDMLGATDPRKAAFGTIRARFGEVRGEEIRNVAHASDSQQAADAEIRRFFTAEEIRNAIPEIANRLYEATSTDQSA
jgi:nucleoside-diphosphate kinase